MAGTGDLPFFTFLNYFDAHAPHESPPGYEGYFADVDRPEVPSLGLEDPVEAAADLAEYDKEIAFLDDQVELILTHLETLGKLENTLVIVTSDHGEEFMERPGSQTTHGTSLSYAVLHVPLVFLWPDRLPAGYHVSEPVSIADVPSTILDLLGTGNDDSEAPL